MRTVQWASLPKSVRIGFAAFAVHMLLLLVDFFFFAAAYAGGRDNARLWPVVRIVAFGLFAWSLLQRAFRPWPIGVIACVAFLVRDLVRLGESFAGPASGDAQRQLTSALLVSLVVGIAASWSPSANNFSRAPAA